MKAAITGKAKQRILQGAAKIVAVALPFLTFVILLKKPQLNGYDDASLLMISLLFLGISILNEEKTNVNIRQFRLLTMLFTMYYFADRFLLDNFYNRYMLRQGVQIFCTLSMADLFLMGELKDSVLRMVCIGLFFFYILFSVDFEVFRWLLGAPFQMLFMLYPYIYGVLHWKELKMYREYNTARYLYWILLHTFFILTPLFTASHLIQPNHDLYLYNFLIALAAGGLFLSKETSEEIVAIGKNILKNLSPYLLTASLIYQWTTAGNIRDLPAAALFFFLILLQLLNTRKTVFSAMDLRVKKDSEDAELIDEIIEHHDRQISEFLHDDILQDIILAYQYVLNKNGETEETRILKKTIDHIRNEMALYDSPEDDGGEDGYYEEILRLRRKFDKEDYMIDFNSDENLSLPKPYRGAVHRILKELMTNVFKHGKGFYTRIDLFVTGDIIYLFLLHEDDVIPEEDRQKKSGGLHTVIREIRHMGGNIRITNDGANGIVNIEIPMKKEDIYEDFIN